MWLRYIFSQFQFQSQHNYEPIIQQCPASGEDCMDVFYNDLFKFSHRVDCSNSENTVDGSCIAPEACSSMFKS